jgi:hypothetical protein
MKAIKQIIDYLRERGVLDTNQLQQLAMQGFLPWEEIFGAAEVDEKKEKPRYTRLQQEDDESGVPPVRYKPSGRRRDILHKGPVLELSDICDRLNDRFGDWERPLEPLLQLAGRLGPYESWEEAAIVLRNAEPEAFCRAVCTAIAEADPSLEALWESLSLEDYRDVISDSGAHGPAVTAYRAILEIDDPGQLGKHAWLLKEPLVRRVVNVKAAQRRTLRACGFSFIDCCETFANAIRRDRRGMVYWAFVLLYSARRGNPGHRPPPGDNERWPVRDMPSHTGWMRAWAQAIAMDPACGPPFLVEHDRRLLERPLIVARVLQYSLSNLPVESDTLVGLLDEYGIPSAEPNGSIPERLQTLMDALDMLRSNVGADAKLIVPLDAEATRTWETFLENWIRLYDSLSNCGACERGVELESLVQQSFPPRAELLCPKSWDWRS